MKSHFSTGLITIVAAVGLGSSASAAAPAFTGDQTGLAQIQYQYPDQRYPDPRDQYSPDPRGGYYPDARDRYYPDPRYDRNNGYGPKWRPGDVLPGQYLDRVVVDWEERGLSRPPRGHQWVRVGYQFILVRVEDQKIARTVNFD